MKELTFLQLVEKTKEEVIKFGYSNTSIEEYNQIFKELILYFQENSIEKFDYDTAYTYFKNKYSITDLALKGINKYQLKRFRACKILQDVSNGKNIQFQYDYKIKTIITNSDYSDFINSFLEYIEKIGLSKNVIDRMKSVNQNFLFFLENHKVKKIEMVDYNTILSFISTMPTNRKSRNLYLYYLRTFLDYLYEKNIIKEKLSILISNYKIVKNDKVPSIWNFEEVKQLLESIDRSDSKGKRNYAIIKLALTTSMRGIDIINLKIQDVDFKDNKISFVQEKTKIAVELPLLDSTKEAIKDYILEARPKANYDNLFLTLSPISSPISDTSVLTTMIKRYAKQLNFKTNQKRGIHSFRHTVLNYLFNDRETSLSTITEISGHINEESLQPYIKTDIERLKELTLTYKDFGDKNGK